MAQKRSYFDRNTEAVYYVGQELKTFSRLQIACHEIYSINVSRQDVFCRFRQNERNYTKAEWKANATLRAFKPWQDSHTPFRVTFKQALIECYEKLAFCLDEQHLLFKEQEHITKNFFSRTTYCMQNKHQIISHKIYQKFKNSQL